MDYQFDMYFWGRTLSKRMGVLFNWRWVCSMLRSTLSNLHFSLQLLLLCIIDWSLPAMFLTYSLLQHLYSICLPNLWIRVRTFNWFPTCLLSPAMSYSLLQRLRKRYDLLRMQHRLYFSTELHSLLIICLFNQQLPLLCGSIILHYVSSWLSIIH